jgi:ParB-like chromosome segregation protein Spo0J
VDGFRRIAAARRLGWESVEALVHRRISETEALRIAFTKNAARKRGSVPEIVHAIALARKLGLATAEIAALLGLPRRTVERHLRYLRWPES